MINVLQIRLFGLGTPWSGDIPLEPAPGRKSFMIKLALGGAGAGAGSTAVWCSLITEKLHQHIRTLVIFR